MTMVKATVTEPQIEEEGTRQKFTSYLVSTDKGNSVRRRYSDFQWLYRRLQTERPGAIVPVIPHSRAIIPNKKFDPDFVEDRRRHLQHFLNGIVEHDELAQSPSMTPFMLHALGTEFDEGKKKVEAMSPTNLSDDKWDEDYGIGGDDGELSPTKVNKSSAARKGLSNLIAKIRVTTGSKELISTADEHQVIAMHTYIDEISAHTKLLTKVTESLIKNTLQKAASFDEIGIPIGSWKTTYQVQQQQGDGILDMMSAMYDFTKDFSTLMRKQHIEEEQEFLYKIQALGCAVASFRMALKQRKRYQVDYTATTKQIIDKDAALAKAHKNLKAPDVTDKLDNDRADLVTRSEREKKVLEESTSRLLRDAEKYKPRLELMLRDALCGYTKVQVSYSNRINEAFSQLLPYLEESPKTTLPQLTMDPTPPPTAFPAPAPAAAPTEEMKHEDDIEVEELDAL
jgi:sorting nexin-1/2